MPRISVCFINFPSADSIPPVISLAIDTSSPILSVAVSDGVGSAYADGVSGTIFEHEERAGHSHGERIASVCDDVLFRAGKTFSDISRIVIGAGPGSFTGLRIGYSFAKGIASAKKIPVISFPSFHAMHLSQASAEVVIGDARSGFTFYSEAFLPPELLLGTEALERLEKKGVQTIISLDELPDVFKKFSLIAPEGIARSLLRLAEKEPLTQFDASKLSEMAPLYLRPMSAKTIAERAAGL